LLKADDHLYIYENVDEILANRWRLIQSINSSELNSRFVAYVDGLDNIVLQSSAQKSLRVNFDGNNLEAYSSPLGINNWLVYNHKPNYYSLITAEESTELVQSDEPMKFLENILNGRDK
jgi:hypothetical protein